MERNDRIFVAGHRGMVGSAIVRRLESAGCTNVLTAARTSVDLTRQSDTEAWFERHRPDIVVLAAARVGGILANDSYPADFIRDNLQIEVNVIDAAWRAGARKLLFLGSSCIYPRDAAQPMREDALLTGPLEPTNQWYAIAKIAGIKMCQAYRRQHGFDAICVQPTNVYGPADNYDLKSSHVVAALIRKFHEARASGAGEVVVWGTGKPFREFIHVDDLADACVFLLEGYSDEDGFGWVNESLEKCLPAAERCGVVLGLENHWGLGRAAVQGVSASTGARGESRLGMRLCQAPKGST